MKSIFALTLFGLLCGSWGQTQYRCRRTPTEWKGDIFEIDYDTRSARSAEYYFNSNSKIDYARVFDRSAGSRPTLYEEWWDYNNGAKYNRTFGGECKQYSFTRPFEPYSVPSDSTFQGRATFGGSLPVDAFSGTFSDGAGFYYLWWSPLSTVGDYECVPVIESFVREGTNIPYDERRNIHITYTNITTVFSAPPRPCTPVRKIRLL